MLETQLRLHYLVEEIIVNTMDSQVTAAKTVLRKNKKFIKDNLTQLDDHLDNSEAEGYLTVSEIQTIKVCHFKVLLIHVISCSQVVVVLLFFFQSLGWAIQIIDL